MLSRGVRTPVTATRNDPYKATLPWHEICNPSTDSASETSNINITKRKIIAPATRNASFQTLFKSTTPANVFATLTNSCACHAKTTLNVQKRPETVSFERFWLPNRSHAQAWCKFCEAQFPKVLRTHGVLTILTSESLSRAGVAQILRNSTSKSAPNLPVFTDFDFRIALARRRGANFVEINFQKCSGPASF